MLQTLPLVLLIVLIEVSIGSVSVLVFLDWRNEVKRGFLISYALIYLGLIGLTYLFQQNFATPVLLNTFPQLDKAWTGALGLPLMLFSLLMIPYNVFLWFDRSAGLEGKNTATPKADEQEAEASEKQPASPKISVVRILRLVSGGATIVAGLVTIFVMAMIFRPLASANLGGVFTVASFFAAAFALGGVLTAMWLGHWYLVTPALSEKPLLFATTVVLLAILAQAVFALSAGPTTVSATALPQHSTNVTAPTPTPGTSNPNVKPAGSPVVTPIGTDAIGWLRILVGFVMPLVLGGLAWKLVRDRSFQSATGMLYLVVVLTLAGEIMARGLFLSGL